MSKLSSVISYQRSINTLLSGRLAPLYRSIRCKVFFHTVALAQLGEKAGPIDLPVTVKNIKVRCR